MPTPDSMRQPLVRSIVWVSIWAAGIIVAAAAVQAQSSDAQPPAPDYGVSLSRIQLRLDRRPDETAGTRDLLRLDYYVQVYGKAPPLELFKGFDLQNSPMPYGVPLHREMLQAARPEKLYPTAVNLNPLMGWAWKALQP